jgi:hypothetical protein
MTLIEHTSPSTAGQTAVERIEDWLLHSAIQLDNGPHRGGIAGWLDCDGKPEFVYLEITGYYLTAMAWLSSGAASSPENIATAHSRARLAAGWIATVLQREAAPPTRLYLSGHSADWRNNAVFSFDIAMAARGVAATRQLPGWHERRRALAGMCTMLNRICSGADVMVSHELVAGDESTMPDRWSTRPGAHHLKAAAAVLRLPKWIVGDAMIAVAQRTCTHWASSFEDEWPCQELHAVLYALEGMLIRGTARDDLGAAERTFARLMELQGSDGTLPETVAGGTVRSDVLAQALRVGLLLRGRQCLTAPVWTDRLDRLTDALLGFIRPDGGVLFSADQSISNTWCAMFAHQALFLRACEDARTKPSATAYELLV